MFMASSGQWLSPVAPVMAAQTLDFVP